MERLQKVLAQCGVASRRKAEEMILKGVVKVDGQVVDTLGYKVAPDQKIEVFGKEIKREEKVVYILNKPKNVISSVSDDKGRVCASDLISSPYRLYPVGRLDYESSGLLIMTNDGELANQILHPRFSVPKTYEVTVKGTVTQEQLNQLKRGVTLSDGYRTGSAKISLVAKNDNKKTLRLLITISEGHNREIRKMFELFNAEVVRLHRIKEANLSLGDLKSGEYRRLKIHEVKLLKKYLDMGDL